MVSNNACVSFFSWTGVPQKNCRMSRFEKDFAYRWLFPTKALFRALNDLLRPLCAVSWGWCGCFSTYNLSTNQIQLLLSATLLQRVLMSLFRRLSSTLFQYIAVTCEVNTWAYIQWGTQKVQPTWRTSSLRLVKIGVFFPVTPVHDDMNDGSAFLSTVSDHFRQLVPAYGGLTPWDTTLPSLSCLLDEMTHYIAIRKPFWRWGHTCRFENSRSAYSP